MTPVAALLLGCSLAGCALFYLCTQFASLGPAGFQRKDLEQSVQTICSQYPECDPK